jgi:hypothetical protein
VDCCPRLLPFFATGADDSSAFLGDFVSMAECLFI